MITEAYRKAIIELFESDPEKAFQKFEEDFSDYKPRIDTIHRNEKKSHLGKHEHSYHYDGDDEDWTDFDSLTVICK